MTASIVVTIAVVAITVLVLALSLLKIALMLRRTLKSLRAVNKSLKAIPSKADPVAPILESLNTDLGDARGLLEDLLRRKQQAGPRQPQPQDPGGSLRAD
jgi:uncharacterized protein YoxC